MKNKTNNKKNIIVWGSVSALVTALLTTFTILSTTTFRSILTTVAGGKKPIMADGVTQIYKSDYNSKKESKAAGDELNKQIAEEGFTLLVNENQALPLKEKERKVSVFGKNSVNLVLGGSGSGGISGAAATTLYDGLTNAGIEFNPALKSFYEDTKASGNGRSSSPSLSSSTSAAPTLDIGETPFDMYTSGVKATFGDYNDAAIVVISRLGGESWDLPRSQNTQSGGYSNKHYLQLDQNENKMLDMVTSNFKKVIVVLNTLTSFQCDFLKEYNNNPEDPRIDSVVWIGGPGSTGAAHFGKLLTGAANFSGRTVDIYSRDFSKDPTFQNFGDNSQVSSSNSFIFDGSKDANTYVSYDEGIYSGYRYYETRSYEETKLDKNINWYSENVIFPFGYGLSYTSFEEKMNVNGSLSGKDNELTINVDSENMGEVSGKDVIELYCSLPYTKGGIEKSHVQLIDFAKTSTLNKNEKQSIEFKINPYQLASYDYNDANGDGHTGYEVEKGDYTFYISKNSHIDDSDNVYSSYTVNIPFDLHYDEDPQTEKEVTNRYTFGANYDGVGENGKINYSDIQYRLSDEYVTDSEGEEKIRKGMSRSNFKDTFPVAQDEKKRTFHEGEKEALVDTSSNNTDIDAVTEMPLTGKEVSVTLRDLIGKKYDDSNWAKLLDSLTPEEMLKLVNEGAFSTIDIVKIKKNLTNDSDGPIGFVNFMPGLSDRYKDNTTYSCEILIGATWNKDLAYQMGKAVGDNAVWGDTNGNSLPYSGWYAPAINLHRSPFAGRNFEYYSEDPILTGKLAVNVINGAKTKGVYTDVKHFALNDQETNRAGIATFCTEQALREIYLKPFEMAVKGMDSPTFSSTATKDGLTSFSGTTGIMSSFNRIGTRWTGGDYRLMTEILRGEWGFDGLVISDYKTDNSVMNSRQMLYAGNDLILASLNDLLWNDADFKSAKDITILRNASHNILYSIANSNSMNTDIVGYHQEWWLTTIYIVDGVVGASLVAWGLLIFINKNKKNPSKNK